LYGRCDVVEIGHGAVVPVEHKIGHYQPNGPVDIQVAAQALCLREMLNRDPADDSDVGVPYAEVFTHADRRRHRVTLTDDLITAVTDTVAALRMVLTAPRLPPPVADRRCRRCSLLDDCLPRALTTTPADLYTPRPLGDWDA
jgi:CRISPR-associated exonuclease Cas4